MIPKVIHYCWFGGKKLPAKVTQCIQSWKRLCPDYKIVRWDESNFDVNGHPFMKAAYEAKAWAFVSDYARLKIIYENGGVYLDTDVELLKNLDLLLEDPCYIGIQQTENLCTTGLGFGAERGSPVVLRMMREYDGLEFSRGNKLKIACPWLNDRAIRSFGAFDRNEVTKLPEVTIYPPRFFDPWSTGETSNLLCGETVSIHHYAASWAEGPQRWKRKFAMLLGPENVARLKTIRNRLGRKR